MTLRLVPRPIADPDDPPEGGGGRAAGERRTTAVNLQPSPPWAREARGERDPGRDPERTALRARVLTWMPQIRRHAIRAAHRCDGAVSVADLTDAGLDGLLQGLAAVRWLAADLDPDRYLEGAVLAAMRRRILDACHTR